MGNCAKLSVCLACTFGTVLAFTAVASHAQVPRPSAVFDPLFRSGFDPVPTYYVSVATGSDSNPGTYAQPWKTIKHAVSNSGAPSGAVIHVAPGTYHESGIVVARDDISIIGYRNTPGDQPPILADLAPTDPQETDPVMPAFDAAQMPLLDGGNRAAGTGINIYGRKRITLRNLNIRNYATGVMAGKAVDPRDLDDPVRFRHDSHDLFNVNIATIGNINADYNGVGYYFGSMSTSLVTGSRIRKALIHDVAAEAVSINGDWNEVDGIRVYSIDAGTVAKATDYYVIVTGSRNWIHDSWIWRKPGAAHPGHGYSVKDNSELTGSPWNYPRLEAVDNLFSDDVAVNMVNGGFVVRHRGVRDNTFHRNTAYGLYGGGNSCTDASLGIFMRDGAKSNTFSDMHLVDICYGVSFGDSGEDESPPPSYAAEDNLITGLLVENAYRGVNFTQYGPIREAGPNLIADSDFRSVHTLFEANRPAELMHYSGTTFSGKAAQGRGGFRAGSYASDITRDQFEDCSFEDINGGLPPGW